MHIISKQLFEQLVSLELVLKNLNQEQYTRKINHLANSTIGEHTRHIIELLNCAIHSYETGTVDYVNRTRNLMLQSNTSEALCEIEKLKEIRLTEDKKIKVLIEENSDSIVSSTFYREIVYNIEHTIHHLALIKVALIELNLNFVDSTFGVGYSTIKYKSLETQEIENK